MSLVQVTAPAVLPLSLAELKAQIRLTDTDGEDDDPLIMGYLRSATSWIDGHRGWLGRALITQTYDYKLDRFQPCIRIPLPPLQTINSITYIDDGGVTQTLATSAYQVIAAGCEQPAEVRPAYDLTWPSTRLTPEAVTIRFTAGYGDSWNDVPEPIRHGLMVLVGKWYDQCEADAPVPMAVKALLQPYRIYGF